MQRISLAAVQLFTLILNNIWHRKYYKLQAIILAALGQEFT